MNDDRSWTNYPQGLLPNSSAAMHHELDRWDEGHDSLRGKYHEFARHVRIHTDNWGRREITKQMVRCYSNGETHEYTSTRWDHWWR